MNKIQHQRIKGQKTAEIRSGDGPTFEHICDVFIWLNVRNQNTNICTNKMKRQRITFGLKEIQTPTIRSGVAVVQRAERSVPSLRASPDLHLVLRRALQPRQHHRRRPGGHVLPLPRLLAMLTTKTSAVTSQSVSSAQRVSACGFVYLPSGCSGLDSPGHGTGSAGLGRSTLKTRWSPWLLPSSDPSLGEELQTQTKRQSDHRSFHQRWF